MRHSLTTLIKYLYFKCKTFLIDSNISLIRFPIDIRGRKYIYFGRNLTTGYNCRIEAYPEASSSNKVIHFGSNIQINDNVHITGVESVTIGDNVLIASKVYISDCSHGSYNSNLSSHPDIAPKKRPLSSSPVKIQENVWIGENVVILPGVSVGRSAIIGASSVVTKNIPDYCIAAGAPAKIIKRFNFNTQKWEKTANSGEFVE